MLLFESQSECTQDLHRWYDFCSHPYPQWKFASEETLFALNSFTSRCFGHDHSCMHKHKHDTYTNKGPERASTHNVYLRTDTTVAVPMRTDDNNAVPWRPDVAMDCEEPLRTIANRHAELWRKDVTVAEPLRTDDNNAEPLRSDVGMNGLAPFETSAEKGAVPLRSDPWAVPLRTSPTNKISTALDPCEINTHEHVITSDPYETIDKEHSMHTTVRPKCVQSGGLDLRSSGVLPLRPRNPSRPCARHVHAHMCDESSAAAIDRRKAHYAT